MAEQSRWRRRKQKRPEEILDAALKAFADHGFAATRLDDIARAAGVSKGTIYLYFESKQALLRGIVERSVLPKLDAVLADANRADLGPVAKLRAIQGLVAGFIAAEENANLVKLVLSEARAYPEFARYYRATVIDRGHARIAGLIAQAVEQGQFRPCDPELSARLLLAPLIFAALWRQSFGRDDQPMLDVEAFAAQHFELYLHGLALEGKHP